jgi:hypothetical protein
MSNPLFINPLTHKMLPWHVATARRTFILWTTLPLVVSEVFWRTWAEVYRA